MDAVAEQLLGVRLGPRTVQFPQSRLRHERVEGCQHRQDDKFFPCALGADCRIIVSGDKQVLAAAGFEGIEVLRPRSFVEVYL